MKANKQGERIQTRIDAIELSAAQRPLGSILLGVAVAIAVVLGGIAAFLVVLAVLVGIIR